MSSAIIIAAAIIAVIATVAVTDDGNSTHHIDGVEYATGAEGIPYQVRHDWRWYRDVATIYLVCFVGITVVLTGLDWLATYPSTP